MRSARRSAAALAGVLLLASGCARPQAATPYGGQLMVMAPSPGFMTEIGRGKLPDEWVTFGNVGNGHLETVEIGGVPALRVTNGKTPFIAVRRVDGLLDVTPYLSWDWRVTAPSDAPHPVSLIVGFRGTAGGGHDWFSLGPKLPPHDHLLALMWGPSALNRGTLERAGPDGRPPDRYIVRGGSENDGKWFSETVDLSGLYQRLWPRQAEDKVHVVFIGFAAAGGRPPAAMDVAALKLSR